MQAPQMQPKGHKSAPIVTRVRVLTQASPRSTRCARELVRGLLAISLPTRPLRTVFGASRLHALRTLLPMPCRCKVCAAPAVAYPNKAQPPGGEATLTAWPSAPQLAFERVALTNHIHTLLCRVSSTQAGTLPCTLDTRHRHSLQQMHQGDCVPHHLPATRAPGAKRPLVEI